MQKTLIKQALATDKPVQGITLCGWIRTRRDGKDVTFVELNDGSCLTNLQCIVDPQSQAFADLGGASRGASVCITGNLEPSPGKGQQWEVQVTAVKVFGEADPEAYPLQKKRHTDEFLRSIAHLRVRTNKYSAVFRIRSEASAAIHAFF
ncbi:MAG: asparagine--tRNA ligase, partial [Desulfovibrio sp.]|nr:asparagine--tRNA ligase [Desulfovibrio sp.]